MKIITVVGARPQFIKAAAISRAFKSLYPETVTELLVHTGQHYDSNMSDVFFDELGLPKPAYHLSISTSSHGKQTGEMMIALEEVLITEKPDAVIVYGDTNSTLAGALVASKQNIPVVHIEAGIRSFNRNMPEEINRILTDHVSTLLFTPTKTGYQNLLNEGFNRKKQDPVYPHTPVAFHCGDIMYDNSLFFAEAASNKSDILNRLGIVAQPFILATIHRNNNTDNFERLAGIFTGIIRVSKTLNCKAVIPLHPRTLKAIRSEENAELLKMIASEPNLIITEPIGFLEMSLLEKECTLVMTDSGGVQKEAYFFQKQCLVLRAETEWVELIDQGSSMIVDADPIRMALAMRMLKANEPKKFTPIFGDGKAAEFITEEIVKFITAKRSNSY
jgi:UDP-GlcNAc3NAcA epimerase